MKRLPALVHFARGDGDRVIPDRHRHPLDQHVAGGVGVNPVSVSVRVIRGDVQISGVNAVTAKRGERPGAGRGAAGAQRYAGLLKLNPSQPAVPPYLGS